MYMDVHGLPGPQIPRPALIGDGENPRRVDKWWVPVCFWGRQTPIFVSPPPQKKTRFTKRLIFLFTISWSPNYYSNISGWSCSLQQTLDITWGRNTHPDPPHHLQKNEVQPLAVLGWSQTVLLPWFLCKAWGSDWKNKKTHSALWGWPTCRLVAPICPANLQGGPLLVINWS